MSIFKKEQVGSLENSHTSLCQIFSKLEQLVEKPKALTGEKEEGNLVEQVLVEAFAPIRYKFNQVYIYDTHYLNKKAS